MIFCFGRADDYLLTLQSLQDESPLQNDSYLLAQASALPLRSEYNEGHLAKAGLREVLLSTRMSGYEKSNIPHLQGKWHATLCKDAWSVLFGCLG